MVVMLKHSTNFFQVMGMRHPLTPTVTVESKIGLMSCALLVHGRSRSV